MGTRTGLIGRDADIEAIDGALAPLRSGTAAAVFVVGEPGIGKTALLSAVAHGIGLRLSAVADATARHHPFGLVLRALDGDPTTRSLASERVAPLLEAGSAEHLVLDGIAEVIERAAAARPVVLLLDDAHAADPQSNLAVHHVLSRLADLPLGVVAAVRPDPEDGDLRRLMTARLPAPITQLDLPRLGSAAVRTLAEELLGAPLGHHLESSLDRAAGNPFFVIETLLAMEADGSLAREKGRVELQGDPLTGSARAVVSRTLHELPRDTVDLLQVAAVLGPWFTFDDVAAIVGEPAVSVLSTLRPALRAGFITEDEATLAFSHALVQESLYEDIPATVRRSLHTEIGRLLAGRGDDGRAVTHLLLGAAGVDDGMADDLLSLADGASALGVELDLREAALAAMTPSHPRRAETAGRLVVGLGVAGRPDDAEAVAARHLRNADDALARALRAGLARLHSENMRIDRLQAELEALDELDGHPDGLRSELDAYAAVVASWQGDIAGAEAAANSALARREATGFGRVLALECLSTARLLAADPAAAVEHARKAVAVETATGAESAAGIFLGMARMAADDLRGAAEAFDASDRRSTGLGARNAAVYARLGNAIVAMLSGDLDGAEVAAESGLAEAKACQLDHGLLAGHAVVARVSLHRGDLAGARASIATGEAALTGPGPSLDWFLWSRACVMEADGRFDEALAGLAMPWDAMAAVRYAVAYDTLGVELVRLASTRDRDRAESVTAAVEAGAERASVTSARAAALHCRGLLDRDTSLLRAAMEAYEAGRRPLRSARAAEDAAGLLGDGQSEEREALLLRAADLYADGGATGDVARVAEAAKRLGDRPSHRRARPVSGWGSLTAAELRIAPMVSAGMTSREIAAQLHVSVHTVDTHLRHIYRKLGVRSRAQFATAWATRDHRTEPSSG